MTPASAAPPPTAIGGLTVDCDDAAGMLAFYTEAFDGRPEPAYPETPCVRVDGLLLIFRESPGRVRPTWPGSDMQMHFEVFVDDLDQQEARLIALGAIRPPEQDETDPTLTVLLDPAGHPFCIFLRPQTTSD